MQREIDQNPEQFKTRVAEPQQKSGEISPKKLATIGGLLDAASTYAFLKKGTAKEANPMITAIAGDSPEATLGTSLGGLLLSKALTGLVGKKYPRVADAMAANMGASQMALGVDNFAKAFRNHHTNGKKEAWAEWNDSLQRNTQHSSRSN